MELTVYHATSSIFIRSIQQQGLTAVKIHERLPDLSIAMREMIEILDQKYLKYGTDWGKPSGFSVNCRNMADKNYKNKSGMDFEHGSLYVTASLTRISDYAANEFGSELITYFYNLYKRLFLELKDDAKAVFDSKYSNLIDIINIDSAHRENLVLRAQVDTDDMLRDTGDAIDLKYVQAWLEEKDIFLSFRMKRALRPEELEVLTIENRESLARKTGWTLKIPEFRSHGMLSTLEIPENWVQIFSKP